MYDVVSNWTGGLGKLNDRVHHGATVASGDHGQCTVLLLAYKRPWNMEILVRSALKCDFVHNVILSWNNPNVEIDRWLNVSDERLAIVRQPKRTRAGVRWHLAAEHRPEYCISIDDDTLLSPEQIAVLYGHLRHDPSVPHGLGGSTWRRSGTELVPGLDYKWDCEAEVECLHQCYAFTRQHVRRY